MPVLVGVRTLTVQTKVGSIICTKSRTTAGSYCNTSSWHWEGERGEPSRVSGVYPLGGCAPLSSP